MTITHTTTPTHIIIHFDGYLHAMIVRTGIEYVHSYIEGTPGKQDRYMIDIQSRQLLRLEYDSREKWQGVLKAIEEVLCKREAVTMLPDSDDLRKAVENFKNNFPPL